jgi:hypothetical protein
MPHGGCLAVDYSGQVYEVSGDHVTPLGVTGHDLFGISCPTQKFCVGVGENEALVFIGKLAHVYPLYYSANSVVHWASVSCASPTFCVAGGGIDDGPENGAGVVATWNGLTWSPVHVVLPDIPTLSLTQVTSMSCPSATFCVGADQDNRTIQWNGSSWHQFSNEQSFTVSCTSKTFCMAMGDYNNGADLWNGRKWQFSQLEPNLPDPGLASVSCISPSKCIAVSYSGEATWWNGEFWSNILNADPVSHDLVQGLSCSTAGFCVGVTSRDHFLYLYDSTHGSPKVPVVCTVFCETVPV